MKGEYIEQLPDRPPEVQIVEKLLEEESFLEPIAPGQSFPAVRWEQHRYRLAGIDMLGSHDPSGVSKMAVYTYAPELAA
jgi:hypothetical protein